MSSLSQHNRADARDKGSIAVSAEIETQTVTMTMRGTWSPCFNTRMHKSVSKCMSEHPGTLILDLGGFRDPQGDSVNSWLHAGRAGQAMEPPVQVLACVPADTVLARRLCRMGTHRFLPVFDTIEEARAQPRPSGRLHRLMLQLPPWPEAVFLSRNLVTDACAAWGLEAMADRGRLVVSELAGNAVMHGRPPVTVSVSWRGQGLHLAVGDRDPRMPQVLSARRPAADDAVPPVSTARDIGQGLRVVEAAATAWGVLPTREGKMVWATLYPWVRRR
ncbi:ATP-binding protein [Actinoplanes sp. NPDC049681]|uniref:ATP-binding protein n=1 Tax=Actinoplanes sp. NPDC049681 TaxID=3363905 RepID=UPI0037AF13E9